MPQPSAAMKIEFTKFIIFWNWEYSCRNDNHIDEYHKILNDKSSYINDRHKALRIMPICRTPLRLPSSRYRKLFGKFEYSLAITDLWGQTSDGKTMCSFYQGAEHILNFIINKKFKYSTPRYFMHERPTKGIISFGGIDKLPVLDEIPEKYKFKIIKYISELRSEKKDILYVDFSANIKTIVESIKYHYDSVHNSKEYTSLIDYHYEHARTATSLSKLPKNVDRNLPRAVGLWMWDYMKERKIQWKMRGKAINAYIEKFQNENAIDLYINKYGDRSQLEKLLTATDKCIQEMKVLSMA